MSMRRSVDQIRTTHTGSLPRPPDMLETLHPARGRASRSTEQPMRAR